MSDFGLDFFSTPEALGEQTGGICEWLILHPGLSVMRMTDSYLGHVGDKSGPAWWEEDPAVLMDRMAEALTQTQTKATRDPA